MSQKNSQAGFFCWLCVQKTLGQFFPSFACFSHKKLSAESRPSADSSLVAVTKHQKMDRIRAETHAKPVPYSEVDD
jgi:hypothetical protein